MTKEQCFELARSVGPWVHELCQQQNRARGESHIGLSIASETDFETRVVSISEASAINDLAQSGTIAQLLEKAREVLAMRATPLVLIAESVCAVMIVTDGKPVAQA